MKNTATPIKMTNTNVPNDTPTYSDLFSFEDDSNWHSDPQHFSLQSMKRIFGLAIYIYNSLMHDIEYINEWFSTKRKSSFCIVLVNATCIKS